MTRTPGSALTRRSVSVRLLHELEAQGVALVGSVEGDVHRRLVLVDQHGGVGGERAHGADDTPVAIGRRAA
jgi:hypothetical protein